MLTILHGDDEIAIHKELLKTITEATSRGVQVVRIDAKGLTIPVLESILGTQELFATEKVIVIDKLHGLVKSKNKDELIDLVSKNAQGETQIILLENKVLTAAMLKKFPSAKVMIFKLPMLLFSFVDAIGTQPPMRLVTTFHQIITTQDPEFVFAMIVRQIRMLLAYVSDGTYNGSPFGREKIVRQAKMFTLEKLESLHSNLLQVDEGQKTSRSALTLAQEIDLFLFKL